MNLNELKPVLAALYNANMPAMLWGQPGTGKSTVFRAVAEILKAQLGLTGPVLERHEVRAYREKGGDMRNAFGMFDVRLSQSDPVDIGGLPREDKNTESMDRLPPSWFPHEFRGDRHGPQGAVVVRGGHREQQQHADDTTRQDGPGGWGGPAERDEFGRARLRAGGQAGADGHRGHQRPAKKGVAVS